MSALQRTAHALGRRDEVPNQQLAFDLAARKDRAGIAEIAAHLVHPDPGIAGDCIKVLYEVGYLEPRLVAKYVDQFAALLGAKHNRLVWGAMIALSTVAELEAGRVFEERAKIFAALEHGSVITVDNGVAALARVAAASAKYRRELWPFLVEHLRTCRAKEVGQHAEKIAVAVQRANAAEFVAVLERRLPELSSAQSARVRRVIKSLPGAQ